MKLLKVAATIALVGALGVSTPALAASWDMPVRSNPDNYMTQNIQAFANEVDKATDGDLTIVLHTADSLVSQPEVMRAVQTGQVQIGEYLMSMQSNQSPIFAVDSVPFLASNYERNRQLAQAARSAIEEQLAQRRLKLLFIHPWPPQGIYADTEVKALDDLKGVKFRAYNPNTARMAELMGANPVTVQQSEVPQAFSTGVVEAMITSPATGVDTQAWDFVKYFYDVKAFIPWNIIVVNQQMFDALDDATRQAVLDAAKAAEERGWSKAPEITEELVSTLEEKGMTVQPPSEELDKQLREVGDTMLDEWLDNAGERGQKVVESFRSGN